jgi:hypothetical protein
MWGIFGINGSSVTALGVICERGKLSRTNSWEMMKHVLLDVEIEGRIRAMHGSALQDDQG